MVISWMEATAKFIPELHKIDNYRLQIPIAFRVDNLRHSAECLRAFTEVQSVIPTES